MNRVVRMYIYTCNINIFCVFRSSASTVANPSSFLPSFFYFHPSFFLFVFKHPFSFFSFLYPFFPLHLSSGLCVCILKGEFFLLLVNPSWLLVHLCTFGLNEPVHFSTSRWWPWGHLSRLVPASPTTRQNLLTGLIFVWKLVYVHVWWDVIINMYTLCSPLRYWTGVVVCEEFNDYMKESVWRKGIL